MDFHLMTCIVDYQALKSEQGDSVRGSFGFKYRRDATSQ